MRENYTDARKFGELVLKDLLAFIDRDFPPQQHQQQQLDTSKKHPLTSEKMNRTLQKGLHSNYAKNLANVYVGGDKYFASIDDYINSSESRQGQTPLIVTGEVGSGKSALLGAWVTEHLKTHNKDSEFFLAHFVELGEDSIFRVLRRIIGNFSLHIYF